MNEEGVGKKRREANEGNKGVDMKEEDNVWCGVAGLNVGRRQTTNNPPKNGKRKGIGKGKSKHYRCHAIGLDCMSNKQRVQGRDTRAKRVDALLQCVRLEYENVNSENTRCNDGHGSNGVRSKEGS